MKLDCRAWRRGFRRVGHEGGIKVGKSERMGPFSLSIVDLALLNVAGKDEENRQFLLVRMRSVAIYSGA